MSAFSGKKLLLLGFIIVLLVIIPLTVFLVQQQQKTTTQAAQTSILSVIPATQSMAVGDERDFQIRLDPQQNQVSFVKATITYDPTKLETSQAQVDINEADFPTTLAGPTVSGGNITFTVSVGSQPGSAVDSATTVATIKFKALAATTQGQTTPITIVRNQSQALSIASSDQFNEDVLAGTNPSNVTIAQSGTTPSVSPSPSSSPATGGATGGNQVPVCSSLSIDRSASGTAPYSITFTVNGNDSDGTISKATFTFGDGVQEDETQGGGLGTNSVNLAKSHTFNNAGTFTTTATLTDNNNGVSEVGTCTQTITVSAAGSGTSGGTGTIITVSPTPTATPSGGFIPVETPTPIPTSLPAVGPADMLVKIGGALLFTLIGVVLLLAL